MKLLVLLHDKFNDVEFVSVLSCLIRTGKLEKITYYNPVLKHVKGQYGLVEKDLTNEFNYDDYEVIFIPGGASAKELRKDQKSLELIRRFSDDNKYLFSICDAPNVLYENKIIKEDEPYSSYPFDGMTCSAKRSDALVTKTNDKTLTGKSAAAGIELGLQIVKVLFGEETYQTTKFNMTGSE